MVCKETERRGRDGGSKQGLERGVKRGGEEEEGKNTLTKAQAMFCSRKSGKKVRRKS